MSPGIRPANVQEERLRCGWRLSPSCIRIFFGKMRESNWKDRVSFILGRRKAFRVEGDSMRPTLNENDVVLIEPTTNFAVGDIVLAQHPYKQSVKMLKRVESIDENGRFSLIGDNPQESNDSRTFGTLSVEYIYGKAVCRLK